MFRRVMHHAREAVPVAQLQALQMWAAHQQGDTLGHVRQVGPTVLGRARAPAAAADPAAVAARLGQAAALRAPVLVLPARAAAALLPAWAPWTAQHTAGLKSHTLAPSMIGQPPCSADSRPLRPGLWWTHDADSAAFLPCRGMSGV